MQRYPDYTRKRLQQFGDRIWKKVYAQSRPLDSLLVSDAVGRISFAEAQELKDFKPAKLGEQFGPLWSTFWFRAEAVVPQEWKGKRVDLLWSSHSEATLWVGGRTIQGLNVEPSDAVTSGTRLDAMLLPSASGGEKLSFQIEMACNKLFGDPANHAKPFTNISPYVLDRADIAVFDPEAWELCFDFVVLQELEAEQSKDLDKTWGGLLLSELNKFANQCDPDDRSTWPEAKKILKALYANKNATIAHELSAIGHAHIDTAWLWPLAETHRKCERTFSTQTTYMDSYPDYKFACSQAYQYWIIKQRNPDLYQRIQRKVKTGQFIPVGGTWIEPDCNIPSGEALARQFLHGQRFFREEFGITCKEFWNPDVFGYNGQLPQICNLAGIRRFLTQKLSWNRFNKPHHHTFIWEGIDGSEVFTHFPPADTYNAVATISQLRDNARDYKDHDRSRHSMMLFGFGDGGGGPTKRMIEHLRRAQDLQGLPRTQMRSSDEFFDLLERDCTDRVRQVGELYFEYHRGTYTTQAATKRGNRKSEQLLHDVEFLATAAQKYAGAAYPAAELDSLWKTLLLNQFHDILPGSSITLVYEDAARDYARIDEVGGALREAALRKLIGGAGSKSDGITVFNTTSFPRAEVISLPDGKLAFARAAAYSSGGLANCEDRVQASAPPGGNIVLENGYLRAEVDSDGQVVSLLEKETGRQTLSGPGNRVLMYGDNPTNYDAWDVDPFHMEQESACPTAERCELAESGPLRASVSVERPIGKSSRLKQTIQLSAASRRLEFHTEVDWHDEHKMLKVAFDVNARAMDATYEMQFGVAERPTHFNTPYDLARYEVPGHRWSDLSEPGFGVALLSESKYGFSTFGNTMRLSLLRSPKSPDPTADMGRHVFSYAIYPHAGDWREGRVVAEGLAFNAPLLVTQGSLPARSFATVEESEPQGSNPRRHGNLIIDTIKKAEDSDATIIRLYECHGARGSATVRLDFSVKQAVFTNLLEEDDQPAELADGAVRVPYRPFQIITLKLT